MSIRLKMPYKIIEARERRYQSHYNIPAKECVVIPRKTYGEEALCDISWLDENGQLMVLSSKMFLTENLIGLNPVLDLKQYELWSRSYELFRAAAAQQNTTPPIMVVVA